MLVFGVTNPKDHERKEIQYGGQDSDIEAGEPSLQALEVNVVVGGSSYPFSG